MPEKSSVKKISNWIMNLVLISPLPWMILVTAVGLAWDKLWVWVQKIRIVMYVKKYLSIIFQKMGQKLLIDPRNTPYLYVIFGIGIYIPTLFALAFYWQINYGVNASWPLVILVAFIYHVLLMGPYFTFFAFVSTLTHKEGHDRRGFFKKPYKFLNYSLRWFISIFYGHVPETYTTGHLAIHHRFDNEPEDTVSTMGLDRRVPSEWFFYLRKFALMWTGISNIQFFIKHKQKKMFVRMGLGMLIYYGLIATVSFINPWFGFAYLILPFMCVIVYFSAINYIWHAFCDPKDTKNEYVNSLTILDGHYNVFNEDYHVIHHNFPQVHWTEIKQHYIDNEESYKKNTASVFRDTQPFEMFIWLILKRTDLLAKHFVDFTGKLSLEEKIALLENRMQPIASPAPIPTNLTGDSDFATPPLQEELSYITRE